MERVGNKNRLIGISCGNQYVITRSIAFKVCIHHFIKIVIIFKKHFKLYFNNHLILKKQFFKLLFYRCF